jgi:hypothetical protein
MRRSAAYLVPLVLCGVTGCQLVDPPADLDRGAADASGADVIPGGAGTDVVTDGARPEANVDDAGDEASVDDDASTGEGGAASRGRILCAVGSASYCAVGTQACCYPDPRGPGTCSTIDACTSSYLFQCSGFADCASGEVCCGVTAYLELDGGPINGIVGARCTLAARCSGASPLVLCDFADTPDRCPAGTTCQPWSTVDGNRWPAGYDACQ